jgi:ketosteroid isomerase-like protein
MSQENVEIVQSIFAPWTEGDFSSADWADPEIEFRSIAEHGEAHGVAAMAERWRGWLRAFEHFSSHAEEYLEAGDQVLVMTRFLGTGRSSDAPISDFQGACLFTLRNGKVVRLALFTDRRAALEAAGLSE